MISLKYFDITGLTSAKYAVIQMKIFGSIITILIISKKELKGVMKVVKSL